MKKKINFDKDGQHGIAKLAAGKWYSFHVTHTQPL